MLRTVLFIIAKTWKQLRCVSRRMNKSIMVRTDNGMAEPKTDELLSQKYMEKSKMYVTK